MGGDGERDCLSLEGYKLIQEEDMLRTSIKSHDPTRIYDFLTANIGPLKMAVRREEALIRFEDERMRRTALELSPFILLGENLVLTPYHEGENPAAIQQQIVQQRPQARHEPVLSRRLQEIVNSQQIRDNDDVISTIVKEYRRNMIEMVATYDIFMKTIHQGLRRKGIDPLTNSGHPDVTETKKIIDKKMKGMTKYLKNELCKMNYEFRNRMASGMSEIQIEPPFGDIEERVMDHRVLKERVQYLNQVKVNKLCSLSPSQFICSLEISNNSQPNHDASSQPKGAHGMLKIYNIDNEKQASRITIKEGSRGLLRIGNYIVAGTDQGYFSFFHQERLDQQQLSPRFFGNQTVHPSITEIIANHPSNGYNIIAFGKYLKKRRNQQQPFLKNIVKIFSVQDCAIDSDTSSLIFTENEQISFADKEIEKIEILEERRRLLMGCKEQFISYDLVRMKIDYSTKIQGYISKIKRINQNTAYISQEKQVTFVDFRRPQPLTQKYSFSNTVMSLCILSDTSFAYGTKTGELGIFDRRKEGEKLWSNTCNHFKQQISDIIKHNDYLISADTSGQIVTWQPKDL